MTTESTSQAHNHFKHRFDLTNSKDITEVVNTIGVEAEKTIAILDLMADQLGFGRDDEYNPKTIQAGCFAAIAGIEDIKAILMAHADAVKTGGVK